MNIDLIRYLAWEGFAAVALEKVADALEELDERTRGEGTPETAPAPTIPGCYCRECKHYQEDDEIEGLGWCECSHPDAHSTGIASREYGCVFGERKEAE